MILVGAFETVIHFRISIRPQALISIQTGAAIASFLLFMVHNPNVVKRAQSEIDEVIGSERLPTYEDRPKLPYLECVMKEVYRFNPMVPQGTYVI